MNDLHERRETRSFWDVLTCASGTAVDRRNELIFAGWCLGWAISLVAARKMLLAGVLDESPAAWILVAVPNLLAIAAIFSYLRFLRMADELVRKVQLDGLAIGFGAGAVVGVGYQLFESVGLPPLEASDVVVVMMFGWAIGSYLGWRRFR